MKRLKEPAGWEMRASAIDEQDDNGVDEGARECSWRATASGDQQSGHGAANEWPPGSCRATLPCLAGNKAC
jgi:hypothetical protein